MLCLSGFELYSRWLPLIVHIRVQLTRETQRESLSNFDQNPLKMYADIFQLLI